MTTSQDGGCPHKEYTTYSGPEGIEYECNWCGNVIAVIPYELIEPDPSGPAGEAE